MAQKSTDIGLARLSEKYRDLQEKIEQCNSTQGQLAAQETENKIVLEELENLEADAQVYKTVGCVLTKQTKEESIENVTKRLAFIKEELERSKKTGELNKAELDKLVQLIQKQQQGGAA